MGFLKRHLAWSGIGLAFALLASGALASEEALARKLLSSQGCKACHPFEGAGGHVAVDLGEAGRRLTAGELRAALVNSKQRHGDDRISDFRHLQPEEIDALVHFLQQPSTP